MFPSFSAFLYDVVLVNLIRQYLEKSPSSSFPSFAYTPGRLVVHLQQGHQMELRLLEKGPGRKRRMAMVVMKGQEDETPNPQVGQLMRTIVVPYSEISPIFTNVMCLSVRSAWLRCDRSSRPSPTHAPGGSPGCTSGLWSPVRARAGATGTSTRGAGTRPAYTSWN